MYKIYRYYTEFPHTVDGCSQSYTDNVLFVTLFN